MSKNQHDVKIRLVKSAIRRPEKQKKVLKGLGLNKVGQEATFQDTPAIAGMIHKVKHLLLISRN